MDLMMMNLNKSYKNIKVKLHFRSSVHFGKGMLATSDHTFTADTLFSALFQQAIHSIGVISADQLLDDAKERSFVMSDAFPFFGDDFFIPKPIVHIQSKKQGDSVDKKAFKKMNYIRERQLVKFFEGNINPHSEGALLNNIGEYHVREQVRIPRGSRAIENPDPYNVGLFKFAPQAGLYIDLQFKDDYNIEPVLQLIEYIGYVGIGGKRSNGMGQFCIEVNESASEIDKTTEALKAQTIWLMLSGGFPNENEEINMEAAEFAVEKRTGFVASDSYSEHPLRKRDFVLFKSGSCFREPFWGDVFDVGGRGTHPVYRYAVPYWREVSYV
jgi:CRISPR-associated protein Csm4